MSPIQLLGALGAQVPVQTGCIQAKVLGVTLYLLSMGNVASAFAWPMNFASGHWGCCSLVPTPLYPVTSDLKVLESHLQRL